MHQSIKEILDDNTILRFSRIPVYDETIDNVTWLGHPIGDSDGCEQGRVGSPTKDIMKPILKIEQDSTIEQALDVFLRRTSNNLRLSAMNSAGRLASSPWKA